jgi:nicotinamide-nucleotide amidase
MFTIEILCVGNELLSGITLNTNAHWLAGKIAEAGGTVSRITVVRDNLDEIPAAVKESLARRPELLIILGGLGATYDDMTLEGVARALGRKVAVDKRAAKMLKNSFARRGLHYRINKVRLKMATIPEGSTPIENTVGSAPSVKIDNIFCLPGVPKEMKAVFESHILPLIRECVGSFVSKEVNYRVRGVSESMIAPALLELVKANPDGMYLKTHPKGYYKKTTPQIRLQLICKGDNAKKVKQRFDKVSARLLNEIKKRGGRIV